MNIHPHGKQEGQHCDKSLEVLEVSEEFKEDSLSITLTPTKVDESNYMRVVRGCQTCQYSLAPAGITVNAIVPTSLPHRGNIVPGLILVERRKQDFIENPVVARQRAIALPGGSVELTDVGIQDALIRELREELGVQVNIIRFVKGGIDRHTGRVVLIYLVEPLNKHQVPKQGEGPNAEPVVALRIGEKLYNRLRFELHESAIRQWLNEVPNFNGLLKISC